jgi:hypothetical protein
VYHRPYSSRTQSSYEVVSNSPDSRLPLELDGQSAIDGDQGDEGEDGTRDVVELLPPIVPGYGRQRLLVAEGVRNIVILSRDMFSFVRPSHG